ncbi:hypothetical protein Rsub_06912 [Raphidocelis subcapitata]|uniref:HYR domain-containing protein n=1 Tax=Raphidocelis subcapitata TaxID=307507 RepID=A0A2V0P8V4_9CHLO|nr:hypothetical protein Rsub_06912 [Raphidocelis subcapitata]|eukprot:GBF94290.1 hypothetical protein Rsub_06912 [Raphidocelis subcapitata]
MRPGARMARAAALLLVLYAAGPAAASRSPATLWSFAGYGFGRSLLQDQTSCCGLVDAAATGGTVACGASGLVLTVPSTDFAAITASLTVTGKAGNTATTNSAILESLTCSNRFGDATWGSAGGATTLAVAAGTDPTCSTGTDGSCQGLVDRISPDSQTAISSRHSCTIRATDGAVLCSGNNAYGNLGTGTTTSSTSLVAVLAPGSGSTILTGATQIAVGARIDSIAPSGQSCACLSSGEAVCWGQNAGPLAVAIALTTTTVRRPAYVKTDAAGATRLTNCKFVSASGNTTLFLTTTGDIYAAGRNAFFELGLGTTTLTNWAAQVPRSSLGNRAAISISAGWRHSCALLEDHRVACVGQNNWGQLGRGATGLPQSNWANVVGITDAIDVQCGEVSTCALRQGGKVSCWGYGLAVGNGAGVVAVPTPVEVLPGGAISLSVGDRHVCALMSDGSVTCWGNGANGQLGAGAPAPSNWPTPQTSPQFVGADSIHAGSLSTCIITGLGKRICTGSNAYGQLASSTGIASINTSPLETVIPASGPLAGSKIALPPPFVTVSNGANAPVCLLQLSVKVAATCDNTPPVFVPALADLNVDATTAAGAVVTYDPPANNDGVPVTVTCTPASGSQFPVGDTLVTCTAGATTGTFNVTVAVAAPAFAASAPTSPFEANVNTEYLGADLTGRYAPSASDPVDGDLSASIETFLVKGDEQISLSGASAYIFPLGSTKIKNTVTNSFGVSSEEFVTIVVEDKTKPVLTVADPADIVDAQPEAKPDKVVDYADKCTATDLATPVTIAYDPPSGSSFLVDKTTTVTCTATDASGNTATGTFTVTISSGPVFVGSAPSGAFEVNSNTDYLGADLTGMYAPSASDPVDGDLSASIKTFLVEGGKEISLSGASAYIFPLGSTKIKNTVTNSRGVSAEETVTIEVADTTKPVVTVADPAIIVDTQTGAKPDKAVSYAGKCTATDLAPVTITYNPPSGSSFPVDKTTTVTCTATDASSNTAAGTFQVTINSSPVFVSSAPTGAFEATTSTPYLGASIARHYTPRVSDPVDGDLSASIKTFLVEGGKEISLSGASAYIFPLGSTKIKNTVTNSRGVSAEETVTIEVADTTKPVVRVAAPANIVDTQTGTNPTKVVSFTNKCTATDLAPVTITYNPPSGSSFPVDRTTTVTCTATDSSGNTATGTFTVTVGSLPVFTSTPPTSAFEATVRTPYLGASVAGLYTPRASDAVDGDISASIKTFLVSNGQEIFLTGNATTRYFFPLGSTDIRHTVTNSRGATAEQLATIRVADTTRPIVTVTPGTIGVVQPDNATPKTVDYANKCTGTDLAPVTVTYSPPSGSTVGPTTFPVGQTTTVTCRATDSSGNFATGTFLVQVRRPN